MANNLKIAALSGSIRTQSYNGLLAGYFAQLVRKQGAQADPITLAQYPLPIYHGDEEEQAGAPEQAVALARLLSGYDAVFIAAPEYNAGITPLLKNCLDWLSRIRRIDGQDFSLFGNKVFALGAASPGGVGGMRGLMALRLVLEVGLGANVIPQMVSVPMAASAFDTDGALNADRPAAMAELTARNLINMTQKLAHSPADV